MSIKSFAPCSDWFFVCRDAQGKESAQRLAGWAVTEGKDGEDVVVGMVATTGTRQLAQVPQVAGTYRHESQMPREIDL